MKRLAHLRAAMLVVLVALLTLLAFTSPASAAVPCEERLIEDWLEDGSIDRTYRLRCYEAAIDALPSDLRDYSDATDAIQRSLAAAVVARTPPGGGGGDEPLPTAALGIDTSSASASFPPPLLALAAVSLGLVAAGTAGLFRRRPRRGPKGAAR
jgi:hypothetical protein